MVRFSQGVPCSIGLKGKTGSFPIPKKKRLQTLQFITKQPQHVLRRRKSSWEVLGTPPRGLMQRGGDNSTSKNYNKYIREVQRALSHTPEHELSTLSLQALKDHPKVADIYERYFKANPELLSYRSVVNAVASNIFNYDATTGAVRDSIADIRQKTRLPSATVSLQVKKDNDFDRLLLLAVDRILSERLIPELFLKSNYFTLRPHLLQAFQEDPARFAGRLENVRGDVEDHIWRDYRTLVNEFNRIYLSRYPFEQVVRERIAPLVSDRDAARVRLKVQAITRVSRTVPGSAKKFLGLEDLMQAFASSPEAKLVNVDVHFMPGIQSTMTTDKDFAHSVTKHGSRSHSKVIAILKGNSL